MSDATSSLAERFVHGYGLIEARFDRCLAALTTPGEGVMPGGAVQYALTRRTSSPAQAIEFLSMLTIPSKRLVLFGGSERWTVLLSNHCGGSDFADYGYSVSRRLHTRTVRVVDRPGREWKRGKLCGILKHEARIFTIFGPAGKEEKSIYCADDGGKWSFGNFGEALPVESSFNYAAKRKRDRFTSENLRDMLRSLDMPAITKESLLNARDLALIQQPGEPARRSTPEQEDDPAFGYYQRGLGWMAHVQTHAEDAIYDLERAAEIDPCYEPKIRQHLERAREALRCRR